MKPKSYIFYFLQNASSFWGFSITFRKQTVAYRWKKERKEKKREELREEKTLFILYETSFSKLIRGLEWDVSKMLIIKI